MATSKAKLASKIKARRTTLSKKSSEELIEIILRKDSTERGLNAKVNNLVTANDEMHKLLEEQGINKFLEEISSLKSTVEVQANKIKADSKTIENLRTTIEVQADQIENKNNTIDEKNTTINNLKYSYEELTKKYNKLAKLTKIIAVFGAIIVVLAGICIFA